VLAGNLQPPPSLQEKVEAALGLCAMKYPNMPDYEPQVAIFLIGKTLDEFVFEYNKDHANFAVAKKPSYVAFVGDARRFKAGFKDLAANTPGANPSAKVAKDMESKAMPIVDKISKYQLVTLNELTPFKTVLVQARPKDGYVFKSIAEIPLGK
jgi:hypothetical protein